MNKTTHQTSFLNAARKAALAGLFMFGSASFMHAGVVVGGADQGATWTNAGTSTDQDVTIDAAPVATTLTNQGTITNATNNGKAINVAESITTILNETGATITASGGGLGDGTIEIAAGKSVTTITNQGTISKTGFRGDAISIDGTVTTINNSGSITSLGNSIQITAGGTLTTLTNSGTLTTSTAGQAVINISGNLGTMNNSGTIQHTAGSYGVYVDSDPTGTLTNSGTIQSATGRTIYLEDNHTLTFANTGTVKSTTTGANANAVETDPGSTLTFTNSGTVSGANLGFFLESTSTITNAGGTISGTNGAITHAVGGQFSLTNSGTITGNITSTVNAAHTYNQSAGTLTGNLTLDGTTGNTFSLSGGTITGNVDLGNGATHTVSMSGGTINGILDLGDTAGTTATVNPASGTTVTLSNSGNTAVSGEQSILNMSGNGTLVITGNLVDTTGGDNDFTLDIDSGIVEFGGASTIDGGIDIDGGTLKLGTNTVTVKTATDFASGTTLDTSISSSTIGNITNGSSNVGITIHDGAKIVLSSVNDVIADNTYTLVDATGAGGGSNLTATASGITLTESSARYDFTLSKSGDKLQITPTISTTGVTLSTLNKQLDDAFSSDTTLYSALNNITDTNDLNKALETLQPDAAAGAASRVSSNVVNQSNSRMAKLIRGINSRQGMASGDVPVAQGFWMQGSYENAKQDDIGANFGYKTNMLGFTLGYDRAWEQADANTLIGVAYSRNWVDVDWNNVPDEIDIDTNLVSVYGSYQRGRWLSSLTGVYGLSDFDSMRVISVGTVNRVASGDYNGHQFGLDGNLAYQHEKNGYLITPKVGIQYSTLLMDSYQETGAGVANLNVQDDTFSKLYGKMGLSVEKSYEWSDLVFLPRIHGNYLYDFLDEDISTTASFQGGGSSFTSEGLKSDRYMLISGAELTIARNENANLTLGYDFTWNESYHSNYVSTKLRFEF